MALPKESKNQYFTYAEYKHWPDDKRWEIIDGEAYDMSPAPGMTHQRISREFSKQICNFLDENQCEVFIAPFDVFLHQPNESEDQISTIVQPDISIICDNSKLSEKGCTGAPDVIIEIISPSSGARDQIIKMNLYEKYGVKEYWIVHPTDRIVRKYILNNNTYNKPLIFDQNGKPSFTLFPDLQIDLYKIFGAEYDEIVKEPSPKQYKKL